MADCQHHIEAGQVYRSATPGESHKRIRVVRVWANDATVVNAATDKRQRTILAGSLHADRFTQAGQPRRTGYVLEVGGETAGGNPSQQQKPSSPVGGTADAAPGVAFPQESAGNVQVATKWRSHVDHDIDHIPTDMSQAVTIGIGKALLDLGLDLMPHSGTGPSHPSVLSGHVLAELRALRQRQEAG
jgi:hypothetical protein